MRTIGNKEFAGILNSTFASIDKLTATKGEEYTGDRARDNQHENFDDLAAQLNILPEKALYVLLNKHLRSIRTWMERLERENSKVIGDAGGPSEPMEGRFDDAILYLLLLKAMYIRRTTESMQDSTMSLHTDPNRNRAYGADRTAPGLEVR